MKLLIMFLLHPPATSSILGPNILFSALFSNTPQSTRVIQKFQDWSSGMRTANGTTLPLDAVVSLFCESI
jgi:hypothetical protein